MAIPNEGRESGLSSAAAERPGISIRCKYKLQSNWGLAQVLKTLIQPQNMGAPGLDFETWETSPALNPTTPELKTEG